MGICSSSCHFDQPDIPSTAKLIHQDGLLQEFDYPVKISHLINPRETFICNSDDMNFGDVVSPLPVESELQPGQLYFALPMSRLNHPLPAEEMAALAVKAHEVLMKYGAGVGKCGDGCRSKTAPVLEKGNNINMTVVGGGGGGRKKNGRSRRKVFAANLTAIEEE